jgi:hypothetical protein
MINTNLTLIAIIVLIVYLLFGIIKKISFKISFFTGVIFVIIATILLTLEKELIAINIASIAYYLLIVAILLAIIEYIRDIPQFKRIGKIKDSSETENDKKNNKIKTNLKFCPNCGTKLGNYFKFCFKCGVKLN